MKSKRKKAAIRPTGAVKKPAFEQCWYCDFNADTGAEAEIVLSKPADDFEYFNSDSDEKKLVYTRVKISRCIECRIAHDKIEDTFSLSVLCCLIGCFIVGVYFGIYEKSLSKSGFLASIFAVIGSIIGIVWIGIKHNFFVLPNNTKEIAAVKDAPQVKTLTSKGWEIER